MAREDLHFRLRLPEDLKAKIEAAASEHRRSMTAEIVARLEVTFTDFQERADALLARQTDLSKVTADLDEQFAQAKAYYDGAVKGLEASISIYREALTEPAPRDQSEVQDRLEKLNRRVKEFEADGLLPSPSGPPQAAPAAGRKQGTKRKTSGK